jgi:signal transduction histidine kinase
MNDVLSRLKEIANAVMFAAEAHDLELVLERIAHSARELAQTRYAALGVPDGKHEIGDGNGLRFFKTSGMTRDEIALLDHLPKGHGLIGAPMRERRSTRLDCIQDDPRSVGFPAHHPHMKSLLGVPIQTGGQLFGVLYLCDKIDGTPFNHDDQLLIETLAGYAGVAIAGAELNQQQNRMHLLEERQRIGMELHDGIIQSLYGIGMQVELLRSDDMVPANELSPVIDSLNDVIEDIRRYIMDLRQRGSSKMSMRDYIQHIAERLNMTNHILLEVHAPDEEPPFSPAVFESVCLILNEALSNAVRHADASRIDVEVQQGNGHVKIAVVDNGRGFDTSAVRDHSGLGLRNMRQRARLYGGTVDIETAPYQGTRLIIDMPTHKY